jgi:sugar phosphate isomerase/epimerase
LDVKLGLVASLPNSLELARGLTGVTGLPMFNVGDIADRGGAAAAASITGAGLQVCQIGAFMYNALSPDTEAQRKQLDTLTRAIPEIPATGCRTVVVNGGNYHASGFMNGHADNFTDEAIDAAARGLEPVVTLAEEHGVIIAVEPMVNAVVCTPERFLRLKQTVGSDALTVTLDICNFLTFADMWQTEEAAKRICETLAGHYSIAHCKDLTVTEGFHMHIDEAPLGKGMVDWETALGCIAKDLPQDGFFIFEHVKTEEDARAGVALLHDLAGRVGISFS